MLNYWAHFCLVSCLTFLFIDLFSFVLCCTRANVHHRTAWFVCYEGDGMTPQSGFYLKLFFLTLNSNPLIGNKLQSSLVQLKGRYVFFVLFFFSKKGKKEKKKKRQEPNVLSEFLIMYSFGDFKSVPLYF